MQRLPLVALVTLVACGPGTSTGGGGAPQIQCAMAHDQNKDCDGDHFTPAQGDCNDADPTVYPGAPELCDGKDHNCNGILDDTCDDDKDGYAVVAVMDQNGKVTLPGGDCNDQDPRINPGAYEFIGNMIDDDCDMKVDNAYPACTVSGTTPTDFAAAMDLCSWADPAAVAAGRGQWIAGAAINADSDPASHVIHPHYGNYVPRNGSPSFVIFSTGIAADENDPNFVLPQPGTMFRNDDPNPYPQVVKNACYNGPDALNVHDYVEYKLTLKVPTNAKSFSFDFNFMTAEYPKYVGSQYNDKFLALLDSKAFKGNISFDKGNHPISVNVAFFQVCDTADICDGMSQNVCSRSANELNGTGFEKSSPDTGERLGGGTGWLTTQAPVDPGETATLRFILFDEGDHLFDSVVLIDNFKWQINPSPAVTNPG